MDGAWCPNATNLLDNQFRHFDDSQSHPNYSKNESGLVVINNMLAYIQWIFVTYVWHTPHQYKTCWLSHFQGSYGLLGPMWELKKVGFCICMG